MARSNRLASSSSPYLLQHAHNPVDWWPWSDEAIQHARARDLPIFLSIGYSTCYWCHVMERESFENEAIAKQMNESFVCIKLDREERPDLDELYMAATVIMNGHGGWPMSVFLDPATLRPFWCGTYFPAVGRPGLSVPTFPSVLDGMTRAWTTQRDAVTSQSEELGRAVAEHLSAREAPAELKREHVADAISQLLRSFDRVGGGFGGAPKFPQPAILRFLLDVRERVTEDATADAIDAALRTTLDAMAVGGLHDHLAGGFHRYCVDATWTVPHFEKMLYDQAQLALVYSRASRLYSDPFYARAARRTCEYVLREMRTPMLAFGSAQDAEVQGREGISYTWTREQVSEALESASYPDDAELATGLFGLARGPNFRDPHHPDDPPANVLRFDRRPEGVARELAMAPDTLNESIDRISASLLRARLEREQPRNDDKVIASWNGLMIAALADVGVDLNEPAYITQAQLAATAISERMLSKDDTLLRCARARTVHTEGFLEDYAAMALAHASLARATRGDQRWNHLEQAERLLAQVPVRFKDASGRVCDSSANRTDLFVRPSSTHDGAMPSGVSLYLHALLDIDEVRGDATNRAEALATIASISAAVSRAPVSTINSTRALLRLLADAQTESISPPDVVQVPAVSAAANEATAANPPHTPAPHPDGVQVFASVDRVALGTDRPAELTLVVSIGDDLHINAADPGDSPAARGVLPTRIQIVGGTGIAAYADYPTGVPLGGADASVHVYTGTFELRVALELDGAWSGTPQLAFTYQACTESACFAPATVVLDIIIDRE